MGIAGGASDCPAPSARNNKKKEVITNGKKEKETESGGYLHLSFLLEK